MMCAYVKDDSEGDDFEPADGDLDDEEEEEEAGESEEGTYYVGSSLSLPICYHLMSILLLLSRKHRDAANKSLVTHADDSRENKEFSAVCVCNSVCVSVCLSHDKTKTAETKITKLGTRTVHHESSSIR